MILSRSDRPDGVWCRILSRADLFESGQIGDLSRPDPGPIYPSGTVGGSSSGSDPIQSLVRQIYPARFSRRSIQAVPIPDLSTSDLLKILFRPDRSRSDQGAIL